MLLFNIKFINHSRHNLTISKHPMLLVNFKNYIINVQKRDISKHPMLLFNNLCPAQPKSLPKISKHPMLLFNLTVVTFVSTAEIFQNILCYCLTQETLDTPEVFQKFQNILCYCLTRISGFLRGLIMISKHPMLLFNSKKYKGVVKKEKFQNILCYCLTNGTRL